MSSEIAAADAIGRGITRDAVWYSGLCSWMGALVNPAQPHRLEYGALGPSLYDGTAGVGLFLAQLSAVTDDQDARRTAGGALRHAVVRAHNASTDRRDGFHGGLLGVAWAASRVARLLGDEELDARARALVEAARPRTRSDRCPDVIAGAAGAILAQLALASVFDDPALLEQAEASGERLMAAATVTRHGWSWADPERRYPHHLCGLSHGAAGIGWALVELFAATDDARFAAAASEAFAYERSWVNTETGSWPDLRVAGQRRGAKTRFDSPAIATWCHGEAGIALTRLRAAEVLGTDAVALDAQRALETTRRHLAAELPHEIEDLTLCHGAAGSADALLCGGDTTVARDLADVALERHGAVGGRWPCGAPGATTPALFRGLSGIGWWFLRLYDSAIPSPLIAPISARLTP